MTQPNNPGNKPELFVDNEPYQWPHDGITGRKSGNWHPFLPTLSCS